MGLYHGRQAGEVKISYITVTRWWKSRWDYLRQAEASLAVQHDATESEWIIVSEFPQPERVLNGLLNTKALYTPDKMTVATKMNAGIAAASGEFIAFMDDDNRKLPDFSKIADYITERGIGGAYCFANTIDKDGIQLGVHRVCSERYEEVWNIGGFYYNEELMVRKAILENVGGFDEELEAGEDYDLALRLLRADQIRLLAQHLVELRVFHADAASTDPYFTGHRTQYALHQILNKHGRLNERCPYCRRDFAEVPWQDTHIQWTQPQNAWMRICRNGEASQ